MEQAFDLASVRATLRKGIEKGYWTLENLDTPSPGFTANTRVDRRTFPSGYMRIQHRNLLRDDPTPSERPEAGPHPRDLDPPTPQPTHDPLDDFDF